MKRTGNISFFKSLLSDGREATVRAPIPLYVPIPIMKPGRETLTQINIESAWDRVMQQDLSPLLILQEAHRYLEKMNPLPLPYEQRARLTNMVLSAVTAAIGTLLGRFFRYGGGIPETREQRESLSFAVHAVQQSAISYKLLFRRDWALPTRNRIGQEKVMASLLRILECLRLEQLLRIFRYQKLPQHAWRDANQLFFALRGNWDVRLRFPLRISLAVEDSASRVELFPRLASVEQLYTAIQLTGLLDAITWPVHLMYRVGGYLGEMDDPLAGGDAAGGVVPAGHVIVYRNQGMPPRFSVGQGSLGEALLMDLNPVIRRVTRDRAAVLASAPFAGETLRQIPRRDRIAFLDTFLHHLQPQQRRETRRRIFDTRRVRVYGGFEMVFRLFHDIDRRDEGRGDASIARYFWDGLAEHASIVAANGETALDSRWLIANEGSGGVQLRQQESDYSLPLYVGRLVAYNSSGEDIAGSRLGYVTRLQRIEGDEVEVAIAGLRGEVRAVMAEDLEAVDHRVSPALLLRVAEGKLRMLCDNRDNFITGERLSVVHSDRYHSGVLGAIILAQADFTVFELHTAG
jgi:hypothetical protein